MRRYWRVLLVIEGTLVGCLRFGLCIPALLVIVTHSIFPPIGSILELPADDVGNDHGQITVANPGELQSGIFVLLWGFIRLFLEILCCLLTVGDTLVTTSHPSARPASPHSFLSLLGLPRWMLRALFAIVVTASYSCHTFLQISERWSGSVAAVYAVMPALSLLLGVLSSFLGVLPVCTSHPWLGEAPPDSSPLAWTPHSHPERNRPAYRKLPALQRVKLSIETISALAIPCFVIAVASFTLYMDLTLYNSCQEWQSVVRSGLHILLSLVTAGLLLYQIRTNSKVVLPAILRLILLYLMSAALSICDLKLLQPVEYYLMHLVGLLIMLVLFGTYLITRRPKMCKEKFDNDVGVLREFFSNFKKHDKQLRCLQAGGLLFAMVGLCFAVVALPLTWYRVEFHPEMVFDDFIAATRYLKDKFQILETEFDSLLKELEPYMKILPETCEDQIVASVSVFFLGLFPFLGAITSLTQKAKRILRQVKLLGGKIISSKREVTSVIKLLDNAGDVIAESRKPLLIGLTTANFGLVAFLLPIIVTGVVSIVIGFWARRFAAELREDRTRPYKVVRGLAILVLVFNILGLILFKTWAPQFSDLAGSLPLLEAQLVREPACALIDCAFVLSIIASVLFLTHAQLSLLLQNNRRDPQEDILGDDEHLGLNGGRGNSFPVVQKASLSSLGESGATTRRSSTVPRTPPLSRPSTPLLSRNETPPPRPSTPPTIARAQVVTLPHRHSSPRFTSSNLTLTLPIKPSTPLTKYPDVMSPPSSLVRQDATDLRTPPSTPPPRFPTPPPSPVARVALRRNQSFPALLDKPSLAPKPTFKRTVSPLVSLPCSRPSSSPVSRSRDSFSSDDDMSVSSPQARGGSPDISFTRALFDKKVGTTNLAISDSSLVSSRLSVRSGRPASRTLSYRVPDRNCPAKVRRRHKSDEPPKNCVRSLSGDARLDSIQTRISATSLYPQGFKRSSRWSGIDYKARKRASGLRSIHSQDSFLSVGLFGRVTAYAGHMERIPPRGWCLSLVLTAGAILLAFQSMSHDWVSFGPVLKPKWARLFVEMKGGLKLLEKLVFLEFRYENDFCGLLTTIADLKQVVPVIFVNEFNQTTAKLINILEKDSSFNLLENDLTSGFQFALQYTVILAFLIPTFLSFLLVFIGFTVSFSHRASSFFPAHELKTWLKRLSLFVILNSCNTVFVMLRQLQSDNLPIFNLQVTIRSGFAFGIASQCLVLLVVVVLSVEIICPPHYGTDKQAEKAESVATLEHLDTHSPGSDSDSTDNAG